jgi:Flp pilus assembly protein TadG
LAESALVLPVFVLLVFGLIDFGRLLFTHMTLQHALREAGRFAVTGRHLTDASGPGRSHTRINSIYLVAQEMAVGVSLDGYSIRSSNGGPNSAGGPGDTVTLSIAHDVRLMTPIISRFFSNGTCRIRASATFRNEPFPPNQTN